jgi:hypothetical protein
VAQSIAGGTIAGYGFIACAMIALNGGNALTNADNYLAFAMAVTLNEIDWADGMGRKP